MVKYYLPGLFEFFDLYTVFVDIFQKENYKFRNCDIGAIYGAPKFTIWNGGRIRDTSCMEIENILNWSRDKNISCSLTYTNCLLKENDLYNIFCNELTRMFEDKKNSITVHSELLEQYLRDRYPAYKLVSSTTKCITDYEELKKEMEKPYDRVVLDYNFNKNFQVLKSIENKERCELLINAVCYADCPRRAEHYEHISAVGLGFETKPFECDAMHKQLFQALCNPNSITVDEIYKVYESLGYEHFKIEGRTANVFDLIEILVYYMVLPEYQMEIRQRLTKIYI